MSYINPTITSHTIDVFVKGDSLSLGNVNASTINIGQNDTIINMSGTVNIPKNISTPFVDSTGTLSIGTGNTTAITIGGGTSGTSITIGNLEQTTTIKGNLDVNGTIQLGRQPTLFNELGFMPNVSLPLSINIVNNTPTILRSFILPSGTYMITGFHEPVYSGGTSLTRQILAINTDANITSPTPYGRVRFTTSSTNVLCIQVSAIVNLTEDTTIHLVCQHTFSNGTLSEGTIDFTAVRIG